MIVRRREFIVLLGMAASRPLRARAEQRPDRILYFTALGHEASVWRDARYQRLLSNAILWSMRRPTQDSR